MAALLFNNHNNSVDFNYFNKMQSGVMDMFNKFEELFIRFKGSFTVTIDTGNSTIKYTPEPGEVLNTSYLESLLLFLNKKLMQIANTL